MPQAAQGLPFALGLHENAVGGPGDSASSAGCVYGAARAVVRVVRIAEVQERRQHERDAEPSRQPPAQASGKA